MTTIRVLIADDHSLVRAGFQSILSIEDDIAVVGEARNGAEAVTLAGQQSPDVVLMDIRMPGMDGLEATRLITSDPRLDNARVVVLTTFESGASAGTGTRAGEFGLWADRLPLRHRLKVPGIEGRVLLSDDGVLGVVTGMRARPRESVINKHAMSSELADGSRSPARWAPWTHSSSAPR